MAASPGDGEHAALEGYYPDPSIPGYVRYWNGAAWVPGTSRPAAPGVESEAVARARSGAAAAVGRGASAAGRTGAAAAVPDPRREPPAARADETGPVFFDELDELDDSYVLHAPTAPAPEREAGTDPAVEPDPAAPTTSAPAPAAASEPTPAPAREPASGGEPEARPEHRPEPVAGGAGPADARPEWKADAAQQSGFGGDRDRKVSWGQAGTAAEDRSGTGTGAGTGTGTEGAPAATALAKDPRVPGQGSGPVEGILSVKSPTAAAAARTPTRSDAPATAAPAGPTTAPATDEPAGGDAPGRDADGARTGTPAPVPGQSRNGSEHIKPSDRTDRTDGADRTDRPSQDRADGRGRHQAGRAPAADDALPQQPAAPWQPPSDELFRRMAADAHRPAGFVRRLLARLLDSLVMATVTAAVAVPFTGRAADHIQDKIDEAKLSGETVTVWLLDGTTGGYLAVVLGAFLVFGVLYEALPVALWGRTLGKTLFGVRVLGVESRRKPSFGAALGRWLVYGGLGLLGIGALGTLWALLDRPWRQGWHDKAAGTFVAR
ncbi:RDD family protein [Streptomyces sp. NPDC093225]|uniref:RDD family protein n=1 Tax=Streptomyces sp. NPDC093225 TaxID=3366034 RepID=UPI00381D30F6